MNTEHKVAIAENLARNLGDKILHALHETSIRMNAAEIPGEVASPAMYRVLLASVVFFADINSTSVREEEVEDEILKHFLEDIRATFADVKQRAAKGEWPVQHEER
jgi:hypothetical protein